MAVENSPSNIKLNNDVDNNASATSSRNSAAVYDIICYYKEESEEDNHTVHAVIENIEKTGNIKQTPDHHRKCLILRLFGCLLIIILLSSPIYGYVTLYLHHQELVEGGNLVLIWPPIIFNAVYLLVTPWLISDAIFPRLSNRNVILLFTLLMSLAISASGFIFVYFEEYFPYVIFLYGVIGGMRCVVLSHNYFLTVCFFFIGSSACIIVGRLFVIINGILNNERLYLINFIYSFAQGVAQFLLPVMIHIILLHFCHDCTVMLLIGALTLHITVITLLVVKRNENRLEIDLLKCSVKKNFTIEVAERKMNVLDESQVVGEKCNKISPYDLYPDIHSPSVLEDVNWKNPKNYLNVECEEHDDHFLEILDSHRVLNSEGVEILETIAEIDEEEVNKLTTTIDDVSEQINPKIESTLNDKTVDNSISCHERVVCTCKDFVALFKKQIFNPLRRSLKIFKFYPSVILKSVDVFSYLLFVTLILPNQVLRQLRIENVMNVSYLITLMGFCWILYSIAVLKFHKALKQNFIHYFHLMGLLAKFLGYLCKYMQTTSV